MNKNNKITFIRPALILIGMMPLVALIATLFTDWDTRIEVWMNGLQVVLWRGIITPYRWR